MSGKIMGAVWDGDLPQNEKFVLLAYADHADHEGEGVFPSVGLVAWKTGYSKRNVIRLKDKLLQRLILQQTGIKPSGTQEYKIVVSKIPLLKKRVRKFSNDSLPPLTNCHPPDKLSPPPDITVSPPPDITVSPEPSITVREKNYYNNNSPNLATITTYWQNNIGSLSPIISQEIQSLMADIQESLQVIWFTEAIKLAVLANVRKFSYVKAILEKWITAGQMLTTQTKPNQKTITTDNGMYL